MHFLFTIKTKILYKIKNKFGQIAVDNIVQMTGIKLKDKSLETKNIILNERIKIKKYRKGIKKIYF